MWRQSRHRACLAVLMLLTAHCPSQKKAAHALGSERERTFTAAAQRCLALPISDCAGLQALRAPIMEDTSLSFDGVESILCDKLVTLRVNSGSELSVCLGLSSNSDADIVGGDGNIPASSGLRLGNVRIVVEDGGKLTVGMAIDAGVVGVCVGDGSAAAVEGMSTLTLEGATTEDSDGGALEVQQGGTAVFLVPVHLEGNSVANGYSGGALHVDGEVTFTRAAHFVRNRAFWKESSTAPPSPSSPPTSPAPASSSSSSGALAHPCGGGVSVGSSGRVNFRELASFEGNSALRGGALCNRGWVKFFRRSFFNENFATGGDTVDGDGGAVFAHEGSTTTFTRRSSMMRNWAAGSGGGTYNAGVVSFETSAEFRANEAAAGAATAAAVAAATTAEAKAAAVAAARGMVNGKVVDFTDDGQGGPLETETGRGGGHLFNRGHMSIKGDAVFRQGVSRSDGGAVYAVSGEDLVLGGISSFEGNAAGRSCKDLYSAVAGREVKLTTTTTTVSATSPPVSAAGPGPVPAELAGMAADATATAATTFAATAPIGASPRRRVSRLDPDSDGGDARRRGPNRSRSTPCQP